ncbi:LysR family transcriptional regulator ArgP [Xanthomonas axonopodis pv. poinsettiicola]|uniref:LysR family transcriptional regulator ArgP n=1 Tax=Xanthomonas TaxID=338 RepID=UPI001E5B02E5|nr:LysR family transcriptional regulator ArgP [Xanthomonas codiaei]MCC8539266.1 LysR family transcriptional regulator ArgP [Xanthomonas codiaei]
MILMHPQLAAFLAVLDEGSFESAARRLSITQSAVSQRIKALEDRLGQLLIVRRAPCSPTAAGQQLLRRVRPLQALESEVADEFMPAGRQGQAHAVAIAVNDDSLATWVIAALASLHSEHGYVLDVRVDDRDHTLELLRNGSVLGAVTSEPRPLQGCNVHRLGAMRYVAIAAPGFVQQYFGDGVSAASLAAAPMLAFNRKDDLQARYMRKVTRAKLSPRVHYLPTSMGFVSAAAMGMGWCLAPDTLAASAVERGAVVLMDPARHVDVPLYWQYSAVRSSTLQHITQAIRAASAAAMHG